MLKVNELNETSLRAGRKLASPAAGEEIVISGLAGRFPDSDDVHEFRDNLYGKVDMVTCDNRRWEPTHPEIPQRTGKINHIDKFDAGFFGVHGRQANTMDPMCRVLMERVFEAVLDAGINPVELKGTKTGVIIGVCFSETEKSSFYEQLEHQNYGITGCTRSMLAQRISYWFQLEGPSYICDTACSSSLFAIEHAYKALREGKCDTAIIGGCNLCLHPIVSLQFARLGVLSWDGACKSFDNSANGYARSEGVAVIILQRAKDAKRIYAEVLHSKTNCDGYKEQGITYPSGKVQKVLLDEFYQECGVSPSSLSYVEAHGTGTKVGDPEELGTLDEVFCTGRARPLLIGSVKSNIGHNEPVSGLCSVTKVIIGMENGFIPPNVHYKTPRAGVTSLETGLLKVAGEKMPFPDDCGLVGINSFGFGGANSHLLLRWNLKKKINWGCPRDNLPRLVCISGRTEESVHCFINDLETRNLDVENVRMLHDVFKYDIPGHFYRGYIILTKLGVASKHFQIFEGQSIPLYYIFGGLDENWPAIGVSLFSIPIFAAHIQRIYKICSSNNLDLDIVNIITDYKKSDIVHQIVGTLAVQTGIAELLKKLGLLTDGLMGYSIGELSAAYFDGVITLEQAILMAYHTTIAVQCVKGKEDAGTYLTTQLSKIMPNTLKPPKKWILDPSSTEVSVSVKHFTTVLLEDLMTTPAQITLPEGVVVLEIGNSGIKDILESKSVKIAKLTDDSKRINGFLEGLGELYELGYNFQLEKLYPSVHWPVSRGTAMISPLLKWDHSKSWFVTYYREQGVTKGGHRAIEVGIRDDDWQFIKGHIIDGRQLFPATGYLNLVWETLAMMAGKLMSEMSVVFDKVKFIRACTVPTKGKLEIIIMIQQSSGNFEIVEGGLAVVTGTICEDDGVDKHKLDLPVPAEPHDSAEVGLSSRDVYKELRLRGYNYKEAFEAVTSCNLSATKGMIRWTGNWIPFMDNMLQLQILQEDTRNLYVPTRISKVLIDAKKHLAFVKKYRDNDNTNPEVPVYVYKHLNLIRSGGIEIRGMWANSIVKRKQPEPVLETYKFTPYDSSVDLKTSARIMMQLALENEPSIHVKVVELIDDSEMEVLCPYLEIALGDMPLIQPKIMVFSKIVVDIPDITVENRKIGTESECYLIVGADLLQRTKLHVTLLGSLKPQGFILSREALTLDPYTLKLKDLTVISTNKTQKEQLVLLKRSTVPKTTTYVSISGDDFLWIAEAQNAMNSDSEVILYTQNQPESGILGLTNCLRREAGANKVRCLFLDGTTPESDLKSCFYKDQLAKGLAVNVYKNGCWGSYRHFTLDNVVEVDTEHCYVNVTVRGDLSSLRWIEGPLHSRSVLSSEQVLVHVHCAAINFRDIMTASGRIQSDVISRNRLEQDCVQGFEFSGVDPSGRRVMGMISRNAMATLVPADANLLWRIPESWSMEEAATVPTVYGTVIYGLILRANLRYGQSILIHSATGGVGQAALNIALHYGCTIFATVGTQEKRDFLKHHYPQVKQSNIGNSRDTSFEQMVMNETNGRGVDVVLNSLADEKLMASVRCLAYGGQFLEIGKFDLAADTQLSMDFFAKEVQFHGIMLDHLFTEDPVVKRPLTDWIARGIKEGFIKPLPWTSFKSDEIEQAFRYMATGKHIGKVLISVREESKCIGMPEVRMFKAIPRFFCNPNNSYIIIGGLGGFGLELADWLILRGARKLVLTSRNGVTTGYQTVRLNTWKCYGARILVLTHDVTTTKGVQSLLQEASDFGQVEAIFNLAVVLRDGLFENQTVQDFKTSLDSKATATKHLDTISRTLCPNLQHFVVFSSVSCGRGNAGQTNYGLANSVMERICEKRRQDNLPALAIQWGAVGDVGLVAELQENDTEMVIGGTLQQKISSCLEAMDKFLRQPETIVGSMVVAEKRSGTYKADNVLEAVVIALGLRDLKTVSLHSTFPELGMDSMMAVEIKQTLEREYEVFLSPQDIRSMTLTRLQEIAEEKTRDKEPEIKTEELQVGVKLLLRFIAKEDEADVRLLILPTLIQPTAEARTVILLPGIEGTAIVFEPLAKNLALHVACVQFSFRNPEETINKMAENIIPMIESEISKSGHFYIVAHSFGSAVALELAAILEQSGYTGELVLIDGAPALMKYLIETQLEVATEAKFQTNLLCVLLSVYMPFDAIMLHKVTLLNCKSFDERIKFVLSIAPKNIPHSPDYLEKVCTATYVRMKAIYNYEPSFDKLRCLVTLCRPTNSSVVDIAEDYMLSKVVGGSVKVKFFEGNHLSMLENEALAEEICDIVNGSVVKGKVAVSGIATGIVKHSVM